MFLFVKTSKLLGNPGITCYEHIYIVICIVAMGFVNLLWYGDKLFYHFFLYYVCTNSNNISTFVKN